MILDKIVAEKKKRIEERKKIVSLKDIKVEATKLIASTEENKFKNALKKQGLSIIGEYKKASPSKGLILPDFKVEEIEKLYRELNIDAYSVLTEEDFFLGSDENLKKVKALSDVPIIRKDFIVDFYQIYEAKVLGASAILLIVAELGDRLQEFYDECIKFKLEPLIEVHNKEELDIALAVGGEIIGINNRNLKDFSIRIDTSKRLSELVPKEKILVSESGIMGEAQVRYLKDCGINAFLIGRALMENGNPKKTALEWKKIYEDS